jgi:hypothetical protein
MSDSPPFDADDDASESDRHRFVRPAIFLDYGADSTTGDDASCEVCSRGMRFRSRWKFDLSTVLNIAFSFHDRTHNRFEAEGIVIECCPEGDGLHLTTLAFVEVPKDLQAALGKVSARLVFPEVR